MCQAQPNTWTPPGVRGVRESQDAPGRRGSVVRKETTPDVQAALASTTDGGATRAGRYLDFGSSDLCWSLVG